MKRSLPGPSLTVEKASAASVETTTSSPAAVSTYGLLLPVTQTTSSPPSVRVCEAPLVTTTSAPSVPVSGWPSVPTTVAGRPWQVSPAACAEEAPAA